MLAAEIIALNLVVLSLAGWTLVFRSTTAQPLRDAGRRVLTELPREPMTERLLFGTMIVVVGWLFVPGVMVSYKKDLAELLDMTDHPLLPVVHSCISTSIFLLIASPVGWIVFGGKNRQTEGWLKNTSAGMRGFLLCVVPVALVLVATHSLRSKKTQHSLLKLLTESPDLQTVGSVFLAAVVLAPLVEELVFRLFLQSWLESFLRPVVAIIIVALGFSAVHGWPDMLPLIPLALVLGGLFYVTRSYVAVVVTHALFNLTNIILAVLSASE